MPYRSLDKDYHGRVQYSVTNLERIDVGARLHAILSELADVQSLLFGGFLDSGRHGDEFEYLCVSRW